MAKMNYELLGRKWDSDMSVKEIIEYYQELEETWASFPRWESQSTRIHDQLLLPALRHLGLMAIATNQIRKQVDHGVDLALRYFDDTWWRAKLDSSQISSKTLNEIKANPFAWDANNPDRLSDDFLRGIEEENSLSLDKDNPKRELKWYNAFTSALFLAGLASRWDDLGIICSWFDATIEPEYQAGQLEDEYMQLFVCIAGSMTPSLMKGADKLLVKVKKCRTKRPKLLCAAWEAANAADQAAFNKAFPETVRHFLSKPEDSIKPEDWVATHQSSIWLIAEHRGLTMPPLSERELAAVITRESAGLAN
jgi:hypothetical protein